MLETYLYESDFEDDFESAEDDFEGIESDDEFEEWAERGPKRRTARRGMPLRIPPRGNAVARTAPAGYATKAELAATAKKLDGRIGVLSTTVKTLGTRTARIEAESSRMGAALRREIATRKKATGDLKRSLDETRQVAMLLPLLSNPGTVTVNGNTIPVNEGDTFSKILPILMFSNTNSSGSGGGMFGGDNSGMMMMALALAFSGGK